MSDFGNDRKTLPPELAEKVMSCMREDEEGYEITDMMGLVGLIVEHGEQYPFLRSLVTINKDAVVEHYQRTGEVPPGVKIVHTEAEVGSNVTKLEVLHGPKSSD